jgi:hypothetical protein
LAEFNSEIDLIIKQLTAAADRLSTQVRHAGDEAQTVVSGWRRMADMAQ